MTLLEWFFVLMNTFGFILTFVDKVKARQNKWRIRERTLFLVALAGGSIGVFASMILWRHKTKHVSFMLGIPVIILLQIAVFMVLR